MNPLPDIGVNYSKSPNSCPACIGGLPSALQIPVARALERLGVSPGDFDRALALELAGDEVESLALCRAKLRAKLERLKRQHKRAGDPATAGEAFERRMALLAVRLDLLRIDDKGERAMDRALARIESYIPRTHRKGPPGG